MRIAKKLLTGIGRLAAIAYPYKLHKIIKVQILDFLYTGWVSKNFNEFGKECFISRPLFLYGGNCISIGDNFRAEKCLRLEAHTEYNGTKFNPQIKIGDRVSINFDCHIAAVNKIVIGNDVLIASKVLITDHYHGVINKEGLQIPTALRTLHSKGPVIIKNNVWIGDGVCIMPDLTIGENCIIGANAVVTKSFPPNSIIGGIPAEIIRTF